MRNLIVMSICVVLVTFSACCHERPGSEDMGLTLEEFTQGQMDKATETGIKKAIRAYLAGKKPADIEKFCGENGLSAKQMDEPMVLEDFGRPRTTSNSYRDEDHEDNIFLDALEGAWRIGEKWHVSFSGMTEEYPGKFMFWAESGGTVALVIKLEGIGGKYEVSDAFLFSGEHMPLDFLDMEMVPTSSEAGQND